MCPRVARGIFHDDQGARLQNYTPPCSARLLSKDHLAGRQKAQRNNGVAEAWLTIDMRADPLPRQILIRNHLIRQFIEMTRRDQMLPQGLKPKGKCPR